MADRRNSPRTKHTGRISKKSQTHSSVEGSILNGSQAVTAAPTLKVLGYVHEAGELSSMSMEYHMTIRTKITDLSTKQASMLLAICSSRALTDGVDFTLYLAMEYLYNFLWRSGTDPLETTSEKVRKTLLVSDIIFSYIRGTWFNLKERERLPEQIIEEVSALGWLPNERTLQSWKVHWDLEKYLEVKIVPVEALINRNKYSTVERYSGYTKGYGNDGSPANPGRTKPTMELDGDDSERPPPQFNLQELDEYQSAIRLIEYAKARRRQSK